MYGKDWGDEGIGRINEEFFKNTVEESQDDDIIGFIILPDANGLGDKASHEIWKTE